MASTSDVALTELDSSVVLADLSVDAGNADVTLDETDHSAVLSDLAVTSTSDVALDELDSSATLSDLSVVAGNADIDLSQLDSSAVTADLTVTSSTDVNLDQLDSTAVLADLTVEQEVVGGDYHPPITANLEAEFTFGLSAMYQDSSGTGDLAEETDPVGYWEDLSGNVNHAIQGTTADKPVAGASFITFDNGSDHLGIDALAAFMTAAGAWSMYMVSDPTADVNSMWRAWNSGNDNYIEFIFPYINPGSGFDYFPRMSQKGSGYINVTSAAAATFDKRLYTFVCNGTTIKVYENGSLIITLTYTGTPPALDRFQISVTFPQNVYRCYFYSAGHDDTDRGTMETSIMSEEGI